VLIGEGSDWSVYEGNTIGFWQVLARGLSVTCEKERIFFDTQIGFLFFEFSLWLKVFFHSFNAVFHQL